MKSQDQAIRLWIVGSIGIDTIATRDARRENLLGGSVTFACAAASFFTKVGAVGVVGSDFPAAFLERYRRFGIDLSGLQQAAGKTFHWEGVYDDDMINRRTVKTELGVFERFTPELPESYRDAPYVLLGNISPELQLHVLEQARGARFVATDTMDLWINIARPALLKVLARTNLLTLNDGEARLLTGCFNLRACAEALLKMGPEYIVIKKGEHGALLFTRDGIAIIPAYPVKAVCDPTGAGDCYAGAFMGWLAKSGRVNLSTLRQALLHGSAVAAFGVEDFSMARLESLADAEIEARVAELRAMAAL
ncbi:MAG: PfkB family carbohydrate kinase [Kiritimatiellae bacterium]|nr:PfkB family carbohydrate kinase [Kiritimatiellia bacterium]